MRLDSNVGTGTTATTASDGSRSVTLESVLRALSARNARPGHQQQQHHRQPREGERDAFAVKMRGQLPNLMTLLNPVNGARANERSGRRVRGRRKDGWKMCARETDETTFVACARENEVKQALQLLRGAIKKHPDVFELGEGTSAVRVFANVFASSAVSDVRCAVSTGTTASERLTRLCFFFAVFAARNFTNRYTRCCSDSSPWRPRRTVEGCTSCVRGAWRW